MDLCGKGQSRPPQAVLGRIIPWIFFGKMAKKNDNYIYFFMAYRANPDIRVERL
jgi:hypothetical protein